MTWIAFDDNTRNAVGEMLGTPVKLAPSSTDPLDYALASTHNSVLLAPYGNAEHLVVLTVKKNVRKEPVAPLATEITQAPTRTAHYVSGGFLGLNDEVELEEEPEQRTNWWKRLFG